jgi:LmbE family N-acetylglucosaminyl deacetylase
MLEKQSKTIMAIGAHTGDAQLTCGMLLTRYAMEGHRVIIVDLTAGERGAPPGIAIDEFRARNVYGARAFAEQLNGESIVLDVSDGELYPSRDLEFQLAGIMRERRVDTVLYHWKNSLHKDHIYAHELSKNAVFFAALPTYEHPLPPAPIAGTMMPENWEDAEGFVPYHYFDVTEAFPLWKKAIVHLWLAEHSLSSKYLRYYEALSICRGALIVVNHATAFAAFEYAKQVVTREL